MTKIMKNVYLTTALYRALPEIYIIPSTLDNVLNQIKNGGLVTSNKDYGWYSFEEATEKIKVTSGKTERDDLKKELLPIVFYGGLFNKIRNLDNYDLAKYSNVAQLTFSNITSESQRDTAWKELQTKPYVVAVYHALSPDSYGLKAIIQHDNTVPDLHTKLENRLIEEFSACGLSTTNSVLAQWDFIYYDPDMYVNPNPKAYHFEA